MLGNRMDQELSMLTDQELAALYRSGDQAAFQKLSARYFFIIRYKASEFYGSGMEPDDLFQEGLLGLLNAVESYNADGKASFRTYAGVCIRNKIISAVRSFQSERNKLNNEHCSFDDVQNVPSAPETEPETAFVIREAFEGFQDYIRNELSEKEFEVLELYVEGKSYDEISQKLGISRKSCDNAMQRIRKKLRVRK
ncbi:MAG: sigma-70 family RNA polymerase sigma factor [Clostridia bacterium]|jgi:RNA polymerase sporulation-specific sigma factor|nr:sigma-70 family RNA polymerase sigma factor [Clostridia bacterium]